MIVCFASFSVQETCISVDFLLYVVCKTNSILLVSLKKLTTIELSTNCSNCRF